MTNEDKILVPSFKQVTKEEAEDQYDRIRGLAANLILGDCVYDIPLSGNETDSIYLKEGKMWVTKNEELDSRG